LESVAAQSFQEALGATRTYVRLGIPDQTPNENGGH
jgi:hypothetical protein